MAILPTLLCNLYIESIFGIRIHTFGHREKFKQRSLFIMNHVCHFDWMFFWSVVERNGDLTCWKAVTKDVIKKFPILGVYVHTCVCVCVFVCGEGEEMWVVGNQSVVNPPPFTARFNAIHVKSSAKASSQGCM